MQKAEADSVAFIICARHGVQVEHAFSSPQTWAGTDPRAQPATAILIAGQRVTTAAAKISRLLDHHLVGNRLSVRTVEEPATTADHDERQPEPAASWVIAPPSPPGLDLRVSAVLDDAMQFYDGQLNRSWVPGYLAERGISTAVTRQWRIGYAPGGWAMLTGHLRAFGDDDAIKAAGLACISSRGTLIDHFRDRVMLPVHDQSGNIAGFLGRARPEPARRSRSTSTVRRPAATIKVACCSAFTRRAISSPAGATPVVVEGPFDAIAVTMADPDRHVGLAPCGTALTSNQSAILAQAADLGSADVLVAFDDDQAGRKAAVRAYDILRTISGRLQSAIVSGKDPRRDPANRRPRGPADDSPGPGAAAVRRRHQRPPRLMGTAAAGFRRTAAGHAQHGRSHRRYASRQERRRDPAHHRQPGTGHAR